MNNIMAVFLNGIAQLEYDRDRLLPAHQAAYLDKMDTKMDAGILLGNETVMEPDQNQRTQFAAANLAQTLGQRLHVQLPGDTPARTKTGSYTG